MSLVAQSLERRTPSRYFQVQWCSNLRDGNEFLCIFLLEIYPGIPG